MHCTGQMYAYVHFNDIGHQSTKISLPKGYFILFNTVILNILNCHHKTKKKDYFESGSGWKCDNQVGHGWT